MLLIVVYGQKQESLMRKKESGSVGRSAPVLYLGMVHILSKGSIKQESLQCCFQYF